MSDLAIEACGLVRKFGDNHAVDGVDLAIPRGEIYGFLGPNGAGKSTTVKVLCTLLAPSAGSATVAGHDVVKDAAEVRIRIGVALQEAALDDKQSGREILDLQARLFGLNSDDRDERVSRSIELADLGDAIDDWVQTYSGGMKRRLDLAAALIHDPEVLFLDEPTTGLHFDDIAKLLKVLNSLVELGNTVIVIEHNLDVIKTADWLVDVGPEAGSGGGQIIAAGTPEKLVEHAKA